MSGWRDQYDRMKRWHTRVVASKSFEPEDVDNLIAFFTCCFHLKDWLKADATADAAIGRDAEVLINSSPVALRLCADVANGSKHLVIGRFRHSPDTRVERLLADFDPPVDADGAQEMMIIHADAVAWPAVWIAKYCVQEWETFLRDKGLLPHA